MLFLLETAISNAIIAGLLALVVYALSLVWRPRALLHCLWLLVLVRFVMPPLVFIPIQLPRSEIAANFGFEVSMDRPSPSAVEPSSPSTEEPAAVETESLSTESVKPSTPVSSKQSTAVAEVPRSPTQISATSAPTTSGSVPAFQISIFTILVGVWVIGAAFLLTRSIWRLLRFRQCLKLADPADESVIALMEQQAATMKLKRVPEAMVLPGAVSPMLWTFGKRAKLLLPKQLLDELSDDGLKTVIVHELAHYRRRDHWVRGLELIVTSLFWWHPLMWLAIRELRGVEEACCDAWVVSQLPEQRGEYARTLVHAVGFLSARPSAVPSVSGVFGKGFYRSVEKRVRSIMSQSPTSGIGMTPAMRVGLALFALAVLPLFPVTGEDVDSQPESAVAATPESPATKTRNVQPAAQEPTSFAGGGSAELGNVSEVAVSPDGRLLAAGHGRAAGPGAFSLWDLKTGQLVGSVQESRRVMDVAFSPDSKLVGYGTIGDLVRVRRTDTLAVVQDITGFAYTHVFVAFSPNGKLFAVGQKDLKLYETTNWRPLPVEFEKDELIAKETFYRSQIDFSPDSTRILSSGSNLERGKLFGRTVIWDVQTGKKTLSVAHPFRIHAAAFSPDGKQFFAGSGKFQICSTETGEVQRNLVFQRSPCYDAGWSPDGQHIVAAGVVRGTAKFDVKTGQQLPLFDKPSYPKAHRNTACYTPDGTQIITGGQDRIIKVWDAASCELITQFPSSGAEQPNEAKLLAVAASPDGRWIAAGRDDDSISIHDPKNGKVIKVLKGHEDVVSAVAFSTDGTLASASYDESIKLWDVKSGKTLQTLSGHENWVFGIAFAPDGKSLASAGYDKTVRIWDVKSGKQTALLEGHTAGVRSVAFSADGTHLASAGSDRNVKVWKVESLEKIAELKGHTGTVRDIAFSPNGKLLVSAAEDSSVRLWSTKDWKESHNLAGHQGMVWSVAFSAGGSNVVTGGFDNTVKVWDPQTGKLRQTLSGHQNAVSAVDFLPDTSAIVSVGMDRSLRVWRADKPTASRRSE